MAETEKKNLEKEIIVIDSSSDEDNEAADNKRKEEEKEEKGCENRSEDVNNNNNNIKAEEKKMLADLSAFPGLAAMFAAEVNIRKRRRRNNKLKRRKNKLSKADDTEKEKTVNICTPEEKLVSENLTDIQQAPIESEPRLSSPTEATMSGHDDCCIVQMDPVATEVLLGEQKSNEEQNNVADSSKLGETTVSDTLTNSQQPPIESGSCRSSSSEEEKMSGKDDSCRVQMNPVETKVLFIEEKRSEERDMAHITKAEEKKILADLSAFPGLAAMFAAELNMRKQSRRRKKRLSKTDEIEKEKQVNISESLTDIQQAPVESGPRQSLQSEATMSRHDDCCIVQMDQVATDLLFTEEKSNKEENGVVGTCNPLYSSNKDAESVSVTKSPSAFSSLQADSCKPEEPTLSEPLTNSQLPPIESESCRSSSSSEGKMSGNNDCCRVQMNPVATELLFIEEKRSEEQDVVAHITKAEEKKILADLSAFPGLAAMFAAELNMRRRRQKRFSKADEIEKEKIVHSHKPEEKLLSEKSTDIQQAPLESGPLLSLPSEATMSRHNDCCLVQIDQVATEVLVSERKSNKDKTSVVNICTPHLSSPSEATMPGNDDCCIVQTKPVATEVLLGEQKSNEEQKVALGIRTTHLSSLSEERMSGNDDCCRAQMNPVASVVLFTEEKSSGKQDVICDKDKETLVNSCTETDRAALVGTESVDRKQNMLLQNLVRPPRYFSPPAEGSIMCDMCGEDDHIAAQCRKPKRKKRCSICADGGHVWKQCRKVTTCIICYKKGHLAKDCPKRNAKRDPQSEMCLKCGNSGHDMFSCDNAYSPDDLKNTRCFICNEFGHLCCFEYAAEGPRQASCYTCGRLGHSGSECKEYNKNLKSEKVAASSAEKSHSAVQQMQHTMGGEQGNNSSTLKKNTEQKVGTGNIGSGPRMFFGGHNAQNQTVNATQGWQRSKLVWVRKPTQPIV